MLKLRARKADDLPQYESETGEKRVDETLSGSAVFEGSTQIILKNIWPAHNQTVQAVGPGFSEVSFHVNSIEIPPDSSNLFDNLGMAKALLGKIEAAGGVPEEGLRIDVPSETERLKMFVVSYFSNVELRTKNTGISSNEEHPFWGKISSNKTVSWDGEIMGFKFSAFQIGGHIKLGVEGVAESEEEFIHFLECFMRAFSFIHQINPWPSYQEIRVNNKVRRRSMAPIYQSQGRFKLFGERHVLQSQIDPVTMLESLTAWFLDQDSEKLQLHERLLHNFQGSDNRTLPFDSQLLGVCTTIEGLINSLPKPEDSKVFASVKKKVLNIIEKRCLKTDGDHQVIWLRLKGYLNSWSFASRRERWSYSLKNLFPEEEEYIEKCYVLFDKLRHPLAHGSSSQMATIENLGLLSGLVNCILLSLTNYSGKCLKNPFDKNMINLSGSRESDG